MTASKNVLWFRRFYIEQWILIFFSINILVDGSPQKDNTNDPTPMVTGFGRKDVIQSPFQDEMQYVIVNGIYVPNSKFRTALANPPVLMRPQLTASYAEVAARTQFRKVNNRIDPSKSSPTSQDDTDGHVVFPTAPSAATNRPTMTSRKTTESSNRKGANNEPNRNNFVPDQKDVDRCKNNPLSCNETTFYPKEYIQKLISEKRINKELLTNDMWKDEIGTRLDGDGDDGSGRKQFCDSTQVIQFPKMGNTKDGEIRFIIQSPELNVTQGIRVESCNLKGDSSCGALKNHLPPTYQLECVQKYSFRNLVSITTKGAAAREQFEIPSCCVCMYRDRK